MSFRAQWFPENNAMLLWRSLTALAIVLLSACSDSPTETKPSATPPPTPPPATVAADVTAPVPTIVSPAPGDTLNRDFPYLKVSVVEDRAMQELRLLVDDLTGSAPQVWFTIVGGFTYGGRSDFLVGGLEFPTLWSDGTYALQLEAVDSTGNVGRSASIHYTFVTSTPSSIAAVDSFSVIEYRYAEDSYWYYAPQLRISSPAGQSDIQILGFEMLTIPGLESPFPSSGACNMVVHSGESFDLFGSAYGDFELAFYARDGHRSTGGITTAQLTYKDASGQHYKADLRGPIVPGELPSTPSDHPGYWGWGCTSSLVTPSGILDVWQPPGGHGPTLQDGRRGRFPSKTPGSSRLKVRRGS